MDQVDELTRRFAQSIALQPVHQQYQLQQEAERQAVCTSNNVGLIYYASGHYTATAHIRSETVMFEELLQQNSINPSTVSSSQMQLFHQVDQPQRDLLIELWKVPPLSGTLNDGSPTSMEREKAEAVSRYEVHTRQYLQSIGLVREGESKPLEDGAPRADGNNGASLLGSHTGLSGIQAEDEMEL
ncbi:hypothetical protein K470DRAFT_103241 [Piedraia hortae CBS 480.64]|uniref:Uncharacterized protein n=1 Tax=Piedraia hortae CBS 480.64 TaxID=1314780 RepID=A0A6A7C7K5_9PEZI|nr:hypothetical protein K470DRAFT_103241 [Piedraia hortae CBS 480.64]